MNLNETQIDQIREMLRALKPVWGEIKITNPAATLPKALPEVLGLDMIEGMMLALSGVGGVKLQRDCAFEIWNALPDSEVIHDYRGFNRICDILEEETEDLFIREMEEIDEEFRQGPQGLA